MGKYRVILQYNVVETRVHYIKTDSEQQAVERAKEAARTSGDLIGRLTTPNPVLAEVKELDG